MFHSELNCHYISAWCLGPGLLDKLRLSKVSQSVSNKSYLILPSSLSDRVLKTTEPLYVFVLL